MLLRRNLSYNYHGHRIERNWTDQLTAPVPMAYAISVSSMESVLERGKRGVSG